MYKMYRPNVQTSMTPMSMTLLMEEHAYVNVHSKLIQHLIPQMRSRLGIQDKQYQTTTIYTVTLTTICMLKSRSPSTNKQTKMLAGSEAYCS